MRRPRAPAPGHWRAARNSPAAFAAARYGVIGVTFALLAWLIVIGFTVVAAAVVSAEIGGARRPDLAAADGEP